MHRESWRAAAHGVTKNRRATDLNRTEYSIVYMYHNFFIHSSVDGHLDCFHVLAIINSASVNTGIHVSFWIMVFLGVWQVEYMGLLGHMVVFFLVFKKSPYCSP